MRRVIVLLALAGCSPTGPSAGSQDAFARELAGRVVGPVRSCVSTQQNTNLRVIDSRTIAYDLGTTLWVNRLDASCPGLSPYNTVIVDVSSGAYCRGDRIRGLEPGGIIPGPTCILRDWTPYRRAKR
jgi:hypothetical protein